MKTWWEKAIVAFKKMVDGGYDELFTKLERREEEIEDLEAVVKGLEAERSYLHELVFRCEGEHYMHIVRTRGLRDFLYVVIHYWADEWARFSIYPSNTRVGAVKEFSIAHAIVTMAADTADISALTVEPNFRRRAIGSILVEEILLECARKKINLVASLKPFDSQDEREVACRFAEKVGFSTEALEDGAVKFEKHL